MSCGGGERVALGLRDLPRPARSDTTFQVCFLGSSIPVPPSQSPNVRQRFCYFGRSKVGTWLVLVHTEIVTPASLYVYPNKDMVENKNPEIILHKSPASAGLLENMVIHFFNYVL